MTTLTTIWFILIFVLFAGYAVLDGFDLGVGVLHLFARNEDERRLGLNAIGPVWDGNEVWLLTAGGALFAAFPPVYAMFGEAFYLAIMLLLTALIFRAVSLEFRSKIESPVWRRCFDFTFAVGSLLAALLLGVALGNVVRGLPIDSDGKFVGTFLGLLNPFSVLVGLTGVALLTMHGAAYMAIKTEGDLQRRMRKSVMIAWVVFAVLLVVTHLVAMGAAPRLFRHGFERVLMWVFGGLTLVSLVAVPLIRRDGLRFIASSAVILCAFGFIASGMFPKFIGTTIDGGQSLSAVSDSSSKLTLSWMLGIAGIGVPLVIAYTAFIYWKFKGKTTLGEHAY